MKKNLPGTLPRRIATTFVVAGFALLAASHAAIAQCQYEVTAIIQGPPCPPLGHPAVLTGRGMNSHSHVVGSWRQCFEGADEAFYWTPETGLVTMTRPPGIVSAIATGINDNGTIIGAHRVTLFGSWFAFVYHPDDGKYIYLSGGLSLTAINNAGIAVGSRVISGASNAVIWDTNTGEVIDLGVMHGPNSAAMDGTVSIDAAGWAGTSIGVASTRAILWVDGKGIDLGVLPEAVQSQAQGMNSKHVIIGSSGQGVFGPFYSVWWPEGVIEHFPVPAGYNIAGASDLNDVGQIVGGMRVDPDPPSEPFLKQHGQFHKLVDLISSELPPNLVLGVPRHIGNDGKILLPGTGIGNNVAVVLVPVDQPTGDLNHDCRVDVHDLRMLLDAWGQAPLAARQPTSPADFNGDGVVDVSDLLILLANWSP